MTRAASAARPEKANHATEYPRFCPVNYRFVNVTGRRIRIERFVMR